MKNNSAIRYIVLVLGLKCYDCRPLSKIEVVVSDEEGNRISDAEVIVVYSAPLTDSRSQETAKCITNDSGMCAVKKRVIDNQPSILAHKSGYYSAEGYKVKYKNVSGILFQEYVPNDSVVSMVLRKIRNPVPLYHNRIRWLKIPLEENPIGYDLIVGDYTSPYGNGIVSDIVFKYAAQRSGKIVRSGLHGEEDKYQYQLNIQAGNESDGFMYYAAKKEAGFSGARIPFIVPDGEYVKELQKVVINDEEHHGYHNYIDDANYYLRIRVRRDHESKIVSALYGKIVGDFLYEDSDRISFEYYINPMDKDRNLECGKEIEVTRNTDRK